MKSSYEKSIIWLFAVVLFAALTFWYISHKALYPSTEDAYVEANTVKVAAQINGKINQVLIKDHAHVDQLTPMLKIDPTPYKIAYDQAQANFQNIEDSVYAGASNIKAAKAMVRQSQTSLALAKKNLERSNTLAKKKIISQADVDKAKARFRSAQDALIGAQSKLEEAKQTLGAIDKSNAKVRVAKAQLDTAKWNLDNTKISAPVSGIVSHFSSRVGDTVGQGLPLFTIVEDNHYWINANFKETALQHIRVGQTVNIKLDMYPRKTYRGVVESISPSSGASMALLPSENSSGNWVKVTQRFPIRINILDKPDKNHPFLIGASAKVTIDTTSNKS